MRQSLVAATLSLAACVGCAEPKAPSVATQAAPTTSPSPNVAESAQTPAEPSPPAAVPVAGAEQPSTQPPNSAAASAPANPPVNAAASAGSSVASGVREEAAKPELQYVSFPSAGVELARPDGFDTAEDFYGFLQVATGASVSASRATGGFAQVSQGYTDEALGKQGMTVLEREEREVAGRSGQLIRAAQNNQSSAFGKWILVFGDDAESSIVIATFPSAQEATLSSALKESVLATKSYDGPPADPLEDVSFAITASSKLKLVPGGGKTLIYTLDGNPAQAFGDPVFVATRYLARLPSNKMQFAEEQLRQIPNVNVDKIFTNSPIGVDGMEGVEIHARAESDSGALVTIFQAILFDGRSYIRMVGIVRPQQYDQFFREFQDMAHSLKRKRKY